MWRKVDWWTGTILLVTIYLAIYGALCYCVGWLAKKAEDEWKR